MITSAEWFNPTKVSGLVAYGTAVTCCAVAWVTTRAMRGPRLAMLTLLESFLLLDIAFSWRLHVHDFLEHIAQRHNEYASRRLPQVVTLCLLLGLLLLSLLAVWRLVRSSVGARLTISGLLLSLALWWTEVISLHQVDHAFYYRLGNIFRPLGDLMPVGVFWIVAALMFSAGIVIESKRSKTAV
jgi:hypothetical protein